MHILNEFVLAELENSHYKKSKHEKYLCSKKFVSMHSKFEYFSLIYYIRCIQNIIIYYFK